jgi:hypothetical protein
MLIKARDNTFLQPGCLIPRLHTLPKGNVSSAFLQTLINLVTNKEFDITLLKT